MNQTFQENQSALPRNEKMVLEIWEKNCASYLTVVNVLAEFCPTTTAFK